jgi:hypothetical protein
VSDAPPSGLRGARWWNLLVAALIAGLGALGVVFLHGVMGWLYWRALTIAAVFVLPGIWAAMQLNARPLAWARTHVMEWAPAAALFFAAALYAEALHYPLPYFDHWDLLLWSERAAARTLTFADLLTPHGTHWHATGYVVMLTTAQLTHMAHWAEVAASLALVAFAAFALRNTLAATTNAAGAANILPASFAVAALFLFSLDQSENWLWGWQAAVFANIAGALTAIWLLSAPKLSPARIAGAMAAAACAIYAFATGLALLPAGVLILLLRPKTKFRWPALALWTVFGLAVSVHYKIAVLDRVPDYVAEITPVKLDSATLAALAGYVSDLVGGAVGRFSDGLPLVTTVFGGGLVLAALPLAARGGVRALAPVLGLSAYGLGAACLIAYGRLGFEHALGSRYISFGNLFWIGASAIVMLAWANAGRKLTRNALTVALALIVVCKIGNSASVATNRFAAPLHTHLEQVAADLCAAYPNKPPALIAEISDPGQTDIAGRIDFLAQHRLSFFRFCTNKTLPQ